MPIKLAEPTDIRRQRGLASDKRIAAVLDGVA
jgi:hypothetical protein